METNTATEINFVCSVVQRKLSASPASSPPFPGTTLVEKEKKTKMDVDEAKDVGVQEEETVVRTHFLIKFSSVFSSL